MKIISLKSENVKRIKAVEITPDGKSVIIGGKNGQGKSSTLDSIMYAIGGKTMVPDLPVRNGKKKAKIVVDIGDYEITRTFTASGGGSLKIKGHTGGSPQRLLDSFTGKLTFDPLKWSEMDGRSQLKVLKELVELDFTEMDEERQSLYNFRTDQRRALKSAKASRAEMPEGDDTLKHENIAELAKELEAATEKKNENAVKRNKLSEKRLEFSQLIREIEEIEKRLSDRRRQLRELDARIERMKNSVDELEDPDMESLSARLASAEENNSLVSYAKKAKVADTAIDELELDVKTLTAQIEAIDEKKEKMLSEASFPVKGLAFDEDGVVYNGIPFNQCSTAERLRISVAMGFAMNPKLNVLLIREGSHLDEDSLKMVCDMAAEHDGQLWIERVGKGEECSVIIDDGEIEESEIKFRPDEKKIEKREIEPDIEEW